LPLTVAGKRDTHSCVPLSGSKAYTVNGLNQLTSVAGIGDMGQRRAPCVLYRSSVTVFRPSLHPQADLRCARKVLSKAPWRRHSSQYLPLQRAIFSQAFQTVRERSVEIAASMAAVTAVTSLASSLESSGAKVLAFRLRRSLGFMSAEVRMARALALMRQAADHWADAVGFAQHALDVIGDGPAGAGMRRELRAIVQRDQ